MKVDARRRTDSWSATKRLMRLVMLQEYGLTPKDHTKSTSYKGACPCPSSGRQQRSFTSFFEYFFSMKPYTNISHPSDSDKHQVAASDPAGRHQRGAGITSPACTR